VTICEGHPPQGLSEARRVNEGVMNFRHWSATGAPHRGWRRSSFIASMSCRDRIIF